MSAAHPRSRGEHNDRHYAKANRGGSSPLARGTCAALRIWTRCCRLIPARAGNIHAWASCQGSAAAHPRSRGEHHGGAICRSSSRGSSPLARGTSSVPGFDRGGIRLIPARAGNMAFTALRTVSHAAHPRSRGEHGFVHHVYKARGGSSPLARGTFVLADALLSLCRLIPARAGNIFCRVRGICGISAHPRSRGEHCHGLVRMTAPTGSSPLARGTSNN